MNSKKVYRGRITELWSEDEAVYAELIVRDLRIIFQIFDPVLLRGVQKGTLVSTVLEDRGPTDAKKLVSLQNVGNPCREWGSDSDGVRWTRAANGSSRMTYLWQRQKILSIIRKDLFQEDFLEVETPLLVKGTCPEVGIAAVEATGGYLVPSTEYQIKRMMVGGFERAFTLTRNFRGGDRGRFHSSEFTMLEWARAYESLDEIEEDAIRFIKEAFVQVCPGKKSLIYNQCEVEIVGGVWERITVRDAFAKYLGLENLEDFALEKLLSAAKRAELQIPSDFVSDQHLTLSFLMDALQPYLGKHRPTFLREWPAFMTTSAEINPHDPSTSVRSELFIAGVEIADGFPFLRDPQVQMKLFERELARREFEGKPLVALDQKYLDALADGIPPGAGMALGVDRLVMVLTGAEKISDVQAFSWAEL